MKTRYLWNGIVKSACFVFIALPVLFLLSLAERCGVSEALALYLEPIEDDGFVPDGSTPATEKTFTPHGVRHEDGSEGLFFDGAPSYDRFYNSLN